MDQDIQFDEDMRLVSIYFFIGKRGPSSLNSTGTASSSMAKKSMWP